MNTVEHISRYNEYPQTAKKANKEKQTRMVGRRSERKRESRRENAT